MQQAQVRQTLAGLEAQLARSNADLAPIANQFEMLRAQLQQAESDLLRDQLAYLQHSNAFEQEVRRIYELGGASWVEVLFSAPSFGDPVTRPCYLQQSTLTK